MRFLEFDRVRLGAGPFGEAVRTDLEYAITLDSDRLLAPFRREAGLGVVVESYGNWESSGLDGHTAGHYLSALALLAAVTDDPRLPQRLTRMIEGLAECQDAGGTGYLGGVPGGRALFESLAAGDGVRAAARLGSSDHWVPWYNLHKTFQGLIDAHVIGGSDTALLLVMRLADWWVAVADGVDDATFEAMLDTEFGGMNDAFAQLALLTGRAEYAAQAERFSHRVILDPLRAGVDELTGLHANTQIPKAVGYAHTALAVGDDSYRRAAEVFWRRVVELRTVAIGGNSVREHFHDVNDFAPMIEDREGPEFCNTYNMLRLTRALAERELRPEYLDYAERALFNHVLGSQHPDQGGFVYFTPMRPRHYRVYSQPDEGFWCCVGTGLEAQASYGQWVFGEHDGAVSVNMYLSARASFPEFGGHIEVDADFTLSEQVAVTVDLDRSVPFALRLRVPAWAGRLVDLRVNGEPAPATAVVGAVVLERVWEPGDCVTFRLPLTLHVESLPDGSEWQAYLAGPFVLAARAGTADLDGLRADGSRMGHVAAGPLLPLAELPILLPGVEPVRRTAHDRWRVDGWGTDTVDLEPFAGVHDARYTVYWPITATSPAARREELRVWDAALLLDQATVDAVALGEQQPESDHGLRAFDTKVITIGSAHWRETGDRIELRVKAADARVLRVQLRGSDAATGVIVQVDGRTVGEERLVPSDTREVEYDIRAVLTDAGAPLAVQLAFVSPAGLRTPGVGLVRVLR